MPPIAKGSTERLFIGVPVPGTTRSSLMRQIPASLPGRRAPPENWHFTLRFLGSTEPARRERVIECLRTGRFGGPFEIEFESLGAFPSPRRARVLWVGVGQGSQKLVGLAEKVEAVATKAGFDAEARRFTAHLTIARMKQPESVRELLEKPPRIHAVMQVSEVILYRSELGAEHSTYTVVEEIPLR